MHQHGPDQLSGPRRGTRVWWQETMAQCSGDETAQKKPDVLSAKFANDPTIRKDLVERIRREIAAGMYETQEKWEAALDVLLDRLAEG